MAYGDMTFNYFGNAKDMVVIDKEVKQVVMGDVTLDITKDTLQQVFLIDLLYDYHKQQIICIPIYQHVKTSEAEGKKNLLKEFTWDDIFNLIRDRLYEFCRYEQDKYQNAYDFLNNFGKRTAEDLEEYQVEYNAMEEDQKMFLEGFDKKDILNRTFYEDEGRL